MALQSKNKSIFDADKIRQEIAEKMAHLSKRNAKLWLQENQKRLSEQRLATDERYLGIVSAIKSYTLFPTGTLASDRNTLQRALRATEGFMIPTQELENLRYTLLIHLGNLHVAQNLFFEALEYFQDASQCETGRENALICHLNRVRCKFWLRDFRDVAMLTKQISEEEAKAAGFEPILLAISVRLDLLLGDSGNASLKLKDLRDERATVELRYLCFIADLMNQWETSIANKFEKFIAGARLSEQEERFYQFEAVVLGILQDLKRGRTVTTTAQRRLASFKKNVEDFHLQECAKILLVFIKNHGSTLGRKLSLFQRMSVALHQLLYGANDFMYQFASILWMEFLWSKGQRTEFARYYIEFKSYVERLKFECFEPGGDPGQGRDLSQFWLIQQTDVFRARYERLGRGTS